MKWIVAAIVYYVIVKAYLKLFGATTWLDRHEGLDKAQREFDKWKTER